jgi:hypothetical protein
MVRRHERATALKFPIPAHPADPSGLDRCVHISKKVLMDGLIYQEWLDWTQLIGGRTLVFYFDYDTGEHTVTII